MYELLQVKELKNFKCIGNECKDNCCHSWGIYIDKKTYKKYISLNKTYAENLTILNPKNTYEYSKIKLNKDGFCPFLNQEKLCNIHKKHGEKMLSYTCKVYPKQIQINTGRIEKSYSLSCPAVLDMLFMNKEKLTFDLDLYKPNKVILTGNKENIKIKGLSNEGCFILRSVAIEIMQDRDLSIKDRIYALAQLCYIIQNLIDNEFPEQEIFAYIKELEGNYKKEEALRYINTSQLNSENIEYIVEKILILIKDTILDDNIEYKINYTTKVHNILNKEFTKYELSEIASSNNNIKKFFNENEYILEHYLVYKIFSDIFPKEYTRLDSAFEGLLSKAAILIIFIRIMNLQQDNIGLEEIKNCIYLYERHVEHSTIKKVFLGSIVNALNCEWSNIIELIF